MMAKNLVVVLAVVVAGALSLGATCTKAQAQTAFDVATLACIFLNAELPSAAVADACKIEQVLVPDLEKVLADQHRAATRYAAEHRGDCRPQ